VSGASTGADRPLTSVVAEAHLSVMRTWFRGWLAACLLLAVFSSSPFGSVEQPSSASDAQALSEVLAGRVLSPTPAVRGIPTGGPVASPAIAALHILPAWTDVAAPRLVARQEPRSTSTPHLSYDALAPPRI
jgi:hypothetical protein